MPNQNVNINFTATANFSSVLGSVNQVKNALNGIKLPPDLTSKIKNSMSDLENSTKKVQAIFSKGIHTKADSNALHKAIQEMDRDAEKLQKDINKINNTHIKMNVEGSEKVKDFQKRIEEARKGFEQFKNYGSSKSTGNLISAAAVSNVEKDIAGANKLKSMYASLKSSFKAGDSQQAISQIDSILNHLKKVGTMMDNTANNPGRGTRLAAYFEQLKAAALDASGGVDKLEKELKEFVQTEAAAQKGNLKNIASQMRANYIDTARGLQQSTKEAERFNSQMGMLQSSADYFFGLQNMFYLMRRGVRDTLETVKELDKAMTETAVVTDKSIGDLWKELPDYTDLANKLGATTKGAYETMTLYYQQGLDKEQTFEIGEETMKMARIAGLDYAETTNMMTAALRGFNMELNQTSAKRVNDVYSKLAAITASDTKELGLAMERTASIAHSANMDFGTTTAFLAQMIETTREAPENLGTAMKTIIARFQELKENPMEIGEVDGEEVSFNRVDKALKTIGVQLVDSKDKFRDLDDVFLDIASKWDGLTQTQQRYIATTAAGSRQQSRFIAMMDNYKRTLELVDAAANSEGASDVQFSKTLDSMESKLNQLHNAWDNFMMGITNNELLKGVVDIGTSFIGIVDTIINGVSKATGPLEDFTKSLLSLGALGIGLKVGGKLVNTGLGIVGNLIDPSRKSSMFSGMTGRRATGDAQLASQINTPIVNVLNNILSVVSNGRKGFNNDSRSKFGDYQKASKDIYRTLAGKNETGDRKRFNLKDIQKSTKELDSRQTGVLYKSNPILGRATSRLFAQALNTPEVSKETQRALKTYALNVQKQMNTGELRTKEGSFLGTNRLKAAELLGGNYEKEIRAAVLKEAGETLSSDIKRKIYKAWEKKGYSGDELRSKTEEGISKYYETRRSQQAQNNNTTNLSRLETGALRVGNAASTAGQSVQGLGMALSSIGMTTTGSVLNTIGSGIMGIGMAAEGAAAAASAMGTSLKAALVGPQGVILGLVAGIAAIGIAIAKVEKDRVKEVRKAAKEIEDTYTKTTEKTTRNLSKLDEYKSDFERLSKGVDSNGYNIDLGTEEYKDYQKIVKDLIKMNPELVEGYNAQGQAIIDKNHAIEESIKAQQREQKEAEDEYTKASSLTKLINSRNTTKRYDYGYDKQMGGTKVGGGAGASESVIPSQFETDAFKIVNKIKALGEEGETVLKDLGKQYNVDFLNLNEEGIKALQDHGSEMMDYVTENITTASEEQLNAVQDSIATLGKHTQGFEEVVKPVYENLSTYISKQQVFQDIPEEFRSVLDSSIKEIAGKKYDANGNLLTGSDMQKMARDAAAEIQNLKGHAGEYEDIMQKVSAAQEEYGRTLNASQYNIDTKKAISQLERLKEKFDSGTSETDRAMSEWVNNQIEKVKNFTQEGEKTLAEGFNTMTAEIDSVNKSYERYQEEGKKGDYYTGSDNLKQIYDDATSEKNWAGNSQSMYRAAFEILGEDNVVGKSAKKVKAELKEVGKYLTEDRDGVDLFLTDLRDKFQKVKLDPKVFKPEKGEEPLTISDFIKPTEDGGLDFDAMRNFDNTQMESMATSLGLSLDTFTALLNKARQFYNIDFSNIDSLRQTLAASETSITGQLKTQKDGEKRRTLYTKRDDFRQEALLNGVAPDKLDNIEKQMAKQGTVFMKSGYEMTRQELSKYFKDWGISDKTVKYRSTQGTEKGQMVTRNTTTADQFVKNLSQLGYSPEEIKAAYKTATDADNGGKQNLITDADTANIDKIIQAQQEANDPVVSRVDTTNTILSDISSKLDIANGILSPESEKKYEEINSKEYRDKIKKEGYDNENKYKSSEDYAKAKNVVDKGVDETGLAIKELEAMRKNATDSDTIAAIDKLLEGLREDHDSYVKKQNEMEQGWETKNKEGFEKSGLKVKNETDKQTLQTKYGVDLNNIMSQSASVNTAQQFAKLISGLSTETQKSLNQQYVNDKWTDISKMNFNDLNSFYKALGPLDQATEDKLTQAIAALDNNTKSQDKNSQSNDKNSQSQDKNTKSNEDNSKSNDNNSKAKEKDSKPKNKATRQPASQKEQVEAGRQRRQSNQSNTPTKPNFKVDFKSFGLKNLLTGKANQRQQKRQEQSGKNQSSGLAKFFSSFFKSKTVRQGPAASSIQAVSTKSAKKNRQESKVDVKVNDKTKKATTDIKNRLKNIKSPTLKFNVKGSAKKIEKIGKAAKDASKDRKLKITADNSSAKKKANEILQKGKDINKARPKLKVSSSFNDSGVQAAKELDGKTLATSYVDIITRKNPKGGNKKNKDKDNKDNNPTYPRKAKGQNNKIFSQSYNISSAAKGKDNEEDLKEKKIKGEFDSAAKGKIGKGGMTLTGELGYEVAWFPSESRSTILGLDGPEMVKLPNDAVIYNHQQSKKIVAGNKKRPDIGSMNAANKTGPIRNPKKAGKKGGKGSGSSTGSSGKGKKKPKKPKGKWIALEETAWLRVVGKVDSWWDNIARKIESARRVFDKAMNSFSQIMNSPAATFEQAMKKIEDAAAKAATSISLQIQAYTKARNKLQTLDKGKPLTDKEKENKKKLSRYEKLRKKGKKRTKKEEAEFQKLKKWGQSKGFINKKGKNKNQLTDKGKKALKRTAVVKTPVTYEQKGYKVSYKKGKGHKQLAEAYKTYLKYKNDNSATGKAKREKALKQLKGYVNKKGKLTKKGKKILKIKDVSKNKTEKVDLSKYIKKDKTGAYVVDDAKINKDSEGNKKRAQAIRDKANELIEDYTQKRNNAIDAIAELTQQFVDAGDQIYDKFFSWKASLKRVELISQKIADTSAKIAINEGKREAISNRLLTGVTSNIGKSATELTSATKDKVAYNGQQINNARQTRAALRRQIDDTYRGVSVGRDYSNAKEKYNEITGKINTLARKNGVSVEDLGLVLDTKTYEKLITEQETAKQQMDNAKSDRDINAKVREILGKQIINKEDGSITYSNSPAEIERRLEALQTDGKFTTDQKQAIEDGVKNLQGLSTDYLQTITDELDAANDSLKMVLEIQEYLADTEQKLGEVLVARDQRTIDNLNKINDSIKNTTSKILDGVRESLDKRRQQDQNAKTEKSIQDKQTRLAYLQNDSAGGHAVEIAQLQKEIGDEQQSYRETLEDQLLQNLQKQADQAAAQRERQISLLQTQIEYDKQNGVYARKVDEWLSDPVKHQNNIKSALQENITQDKFRTSYQTALDNAKINEELATIQSNIASLPAVKEAAKKQSNIATEDTSNGGKTEDVQAAYNKLLQARGSKTNSGDENWGSIGRTALETQLLRGKELNKSEGEVLTDLAKTHALSWTEVFSAYSNLKGKDVAMRKITEYFGDSLDEYQQAGYAKVFGEGILNALKNIDDKNPPKTIVKFPGASGVLKKYKGKKVQVGGSDGRIDGSGRIVWHKGDGNLARYTPDTGTIETIKYNKNKFIEGAGLVKKNGKWTQDKSKITWTYTWEELAEALKTKKAIDKEFTQGGGYLKKFKTGGLADYTGPAWMDGTKSKPELVLDAQDTKNFLALKDTLGQLNTNELGGASTGDLNFDIDINVDKIDNDYDVRRIVDVVKKEITKNAGYRNVKIVRNMK